jgi:hypothetical protein
LRNIRARLDRLILTIAREHDETLATRLVHEFRDLRGAEFSEAIAVLFSNNQAGANGTDAAVLLAGLWAEQDLSAARMWLAGLKSYQDYFAGTIFDAWARLDTKGMCEWLQTHPEELQSEPLRRAATRSLAEGLFRLDPEHPFRVMNQLHVDPNLHAKEEIYRLLARRDPPSAAAQALLEPSETDRANVVTHIIMEWAPRAPAAAREWAEQLSDPLLADTALASLGTALAYGDPRRGADFLATIPQTDKGREALSNALSWWAICDLPAAFDWAISLKDESVGRWAFRSICQASDEPVIATLPEDRRARAEQWWREWRDSTAAEKEKPPGQ